MGKEETAEVALRCEGLLTEKHLNIYPAALPVTRKSGARWEAEGIKAPYPVRTFTTVRLSRNTFPNGSHCPSRAAKTLDTGARRHRLHRSSGLSCSNATR